MLLLSISIRIKNSITKFPDVKGVNTIKGDEIQRQNKTTVAEESNMDKEQIDLIKQLSEKINEEKGSYSIFIKDLYDSEEIEIGSVKGFKPASTFKLFTAMLILKDIEEERYDLNQKVLFYQDEEIDKESTKYYVSLEELLKLMIVNSSNTAHRALLNKLGMDGGKEKIDERIYQELRLYDTSLVDFKTTSRDLGLLLEKLYWNEYLNEEYSMYLIDLMKESTEFNRIKAGLPEGIEVANKYGSLGSAHHDAGIIYGNRTDYALVILSDGVGLNSASKVEKEISLMVWKYMDNKQYY
ncbi:serine hydrolase [Candidatus Dojkabacteria bacterium]|nr:serine hydrolase [Candidatus Dojkabacteria bacterium]